MTGKWKSKPKKVVETSLGKAPKESDKGPDVSHLRKPIITSVYNLKQIFSLFQTATTEVQDYISYECDLLYECRVCRTIFRSLANFILHKRSYCREKWHVGGGNTEGGLVINEDLKTSDEDSRCTTPQSDSIKLDNPETKKKTILPVIDKLLKRQRIQILAKDVLNEDLSNKADHSDDDVVFVSEENNVVLQKIDSSEAAVFQSSVKNSEKVEQSKEGLMKSEVLEIHGILDNNEAALGADGKVSNFESKKLSNRSIPKQNLVCTECNFTFSTEKTLTHHIKYKHNKTCIVFPCPDCKETFSNAWSVYRHLYKIHRRTTSQVRRMRYLVHSSGIRKDQEPEKKKRKLNIEDENEENQWMNNFESDKDIQMCGGCGKRFERKAALHSHSQMCTKRIAICNSIKNGKVAKSEKKEKVEQVNVKLKGAARRKQNAPITIQHINEEKVKEEKKVDMKAIAEKDEVDEEKVATELTKDHETKVTSDMKEEIIDHSESVTITKSLDSDVTITKHTESNTGSSLSLVTLPVLPEIEIFTISDDSTDSESSEKLKSKRKRKWKFDPSVEISDEYKEYVNDDEDLCFLSQMMSFIDENELKCNSCETTFLSLYMLLRHMSLHFSWYRFQCSKCSFMSFHKYDCTTHAYSRHATPINLIDSTVLPIPQWKVLYASHDFKKLEEDEENQSDLIIMPRLEAIDEKQEIHENGLQNSETIILEDDDMPDITENGSFSDTVVLSDDDRKDVDKKKIKAGPSNIVSSRPIRNRTRSVKTVQNDFIYDFAKVLKFNDNSTKNKKVKKSVSKTQ